MNIIKKSQNNLGMNVQIVQYIVFFVEAIEKSEKKSEFISNTQLLNNFLKLVEQFDEIVRNTLNETEYLVSKEDIETTEKIFEVEDNLEDELTEVSRKLDLGHEETLILAIKMMRQVYS